MIVTPLSSSHLHLDAALLSSVRFEAIGPSKGQSLGPSEFWLRTQWVQRHKLAVDVEMKLEAPGVFNSHVVFQVHIRNEPVTVDPSMEDHFWKTVAAIMAPSIAYPFMREIVTSLALRAGIPAVLPIMDTSKLFDPQTVELPSKRPEK